MQHGSVRSRYFTNTPLKYSMDYQAAKSFILDKLSNELSDKLYYHGVHHTLDVLEVTSELCRVLGISAYETTLLKTAALFHDSGFTISSDNHEELGCNIARQHLPGFGYSEQEIERICGMIIATRIPQSPKNKLEEIICDADLDYLGRDDFYPIGDSLFAELKAFNRIGTEEDWNRIQVRFLESHNFFTRFNILRRQPQKLAHLSDLKNLVASYDH